MIYPRNFESKTGFDAVRHMVADRCGSPLSAAKADEMTFSAVFDTVSRRLGEVAEFVTVLGGSEDFPAAVIRDITARLRALRPEGTFLTAAELIDLGTSLSSMAAIEAFFRSKRTDEGTSTLPLLDDLARRLTIFPALTALIGNTVDRWG